MSIQPISSAILPTVQDISSQRISDLSTTSEKVNYLVVIRDLLVGLSFILGAGGFLLAVVFNPAWALATIPAIALAIIGIRLASDEIESLKKPEYISNQPMGLKSTGNDCWINSALQLYFNIPLLHRAPLNGYTNHLQLLEKAYDQYQSERKKSSSGEPIQYVSAVDSQSIREWLYYEANGAFCTNFKKKLKIQEKLCYLKILVKRDDEWKLDIPKFKDFFKINHIEKETLIRLLDEINPQLNLRNRFANNQLSLDEIIKLIPSFLPPNEDLLPITQPRSSQEDPIGFFRYLFSTTHSFLPMKQTRTFFEGPNANPLPVEPSTIDPKLVFIELDIEIEGKAIGDSIEALFNKFFLNEFEGELEKVDQVRLQRQTAYNRVKTSFVLDSQGSPPQDFSIGLKRWTINEKGEKVKINRSLKPMPFVTLTKEQCARQPQYECDGFIDHMGTYAGGHYISYVKRDGEWWMLNDSNYPRKISSEAAIEKMSSAVFFHYSYNAPRPTSIRSTSERSMVVRSTASERVI